MKLAPKPASGVAPEVPALPADVLAGLGETGAAFAAGCWREFSGWTVAELALLKLAAKALDDEADASDARGRRLAARTFAGIVSQLKLTERTT